MQLKLFEVRNIFKKYSLILLLTLLYVLMLPGSLSQAFVH
jgi:hypothetical protein